MQLKWPKTTKPVAPNAEPTSDPFRLEPLSLRTHDDFHDEQNSPRAREPRGFKFVAEEGPQGKQNGQELFEPGVERNHPCLDVGPSLGSNEQNEIVMDDSVQYCTPSDSSLGVLRGRVCGETIYCPVRNYT